MMTVDFHGTDFGAFVLAGNDAGVLEISIDGDAFTSHPLYDTQYSKTLQLPYARMFRSGLANGLSWAHGIDTEGAPLRAF